MNNTSDDLLKDGWGHRAAGDRLLMLLKTRGSQTAANLGAALGVTAEAARQQLVKLAADGLVEATSEVRGVGRPVQLWRLTQTGHGRFPDAHAELTLQIIQSVRTELGESVLERLITARERDSRAAYLTELSDAAGLAQRVERLAAIRTREGYMAEWWAENDEYVLAENHCPICAAATACQGFCRSELALFQVVLGSNVVVTRAEHILGGARRCLYRITPQRGSDE